MKLGKRYVGMLVVFACLFFFIGLAGNSDAADIKIVSINTGKVFEAHPALKEAIEKFQTQAGEMQKQIEGIESEEEKSNAQMQMQQQMRELAMNLQEEAFNKMKEDVQKFAKKKGYTYVVDQNALIAGGKDITEEVIASFEKAGDSSEKK
ncbi:MAG: OmpH family outer membrane protein [Candidatus Ratteibacteria bacterium]|nr:OmpH family outer membrane protein [Candidatus Ratteibacteria bacterium]